MSVPRDPGHYLHQQAQRLAAHLLLLAPEETALEAYARPLVGDAVTDPAALVARLLEERENTVGLLADPALEAFPVARLVRRFGLSVLDHDLLLAAALPEVDDAFGAACARLRGGAAARRPTLGLAFRALVPPELRWELRARLHDSPLWDAGLLAPADADLPFPDRSLVPTESVVAALEGRTPERLTGGARVSALEPAADPDTVLGLEHWPSLRQQAEQLASWTRMVGGGLVHVPEACLELTQLLSAGLADALGARLLTVAAGADGSVALREAGVLSVASGGAVVLVTLSAASARLSVPAGLVLDGPCVLHTPPGCAVALPRHLPARRLAPARPRPLEQASVWQQLLGPARANVRVDQLATQTWLPVPLIAKVVELARQRAKLQGREAPEHGDVAQALAELAPPPSAAMAQTRQPRVPWSRLVLPPMVRSELEGLVQRVRHRITVQDRWKMRNGETRGHGLVALLHGEPGTGKTLAAEAVATELDLPLLSVDLSRVVSKYIGETEKNLAQVFDAAEGFKAVLFFDEAEALFGRRTAVKDAHDRYANLETNYLLQRLEALEGVAVLATNLRQNLDEAFTRRLAFVIGFSRPSARLQGRIWRQHLPQPQLEDDVDLDALTRFDLVGGEIRNVALTAAYAAASSDGRITQSLLLDASRRELAKRGRAAPV